MVCSALKAFWIFCKQSCAGVHACNSSTCGLCRMKSLRLVLDTWGKGEGKGEKRGEEDKEEEEGPGEMA